MNQLSLTKNSQKVLTTADAMPGCALREEKDKSSYKSNNLIVIKEAIEPEEVQEEDLKKKEDGIAFKIGNT